MSTACITVSYRQHGITVSLRVRAAAAALAPSEPDESPEAGSSPAPLDLSEAVAPETLRHMLRTLHSTQQALRADLLESQARRLHADFSTASVNLRGAA